MHTIKTCLRCHHGELRLVEGAVGRLDCYCLQTGLLSGAGCDAFVPLRGPRTDPRGEAYSAGYFKRMAARQLCLRVLDGTFTYFMAQVRQRSGQTVAEEVEAAGRAAWRTRGEWMTPQQLEEASHVRV